MKDIQQFVKEYAAELTALFDAQKVGVYITDCDTETLIVNSESERVGSVRRENLIGKYMAELLEAGYIKESVTSKVLKSGREEEIIQEMGDGSQVYIQGVPLYQDGRIRLVVCTERDITEKVRMTTELEYLRKQGRKETRGMVAESYEMKLLTGKILRVAQLDITVLLTGESGTGKETFANLIYENSLRNGKPFLKINCAAIPENLMESELFGYEKGAFTGADKSGKPGIFELADKGTLFLDEIGDIPLSLQSRLLRVLEEREFMRIGGKEIIPTDARIIAATNIDLKKAVEEGRFREDLFYRLNIIPVEIPPLRRRQEDIGPLAQFFIEMFNRKYRTGKTLRPDAEAALREYSWPGNIRELRNLIERLVVSFDGKEITRFQVVSQLGGAAPAQEEELPLRSYREMMETYEKEILERALRQAGNLTRAARMLEIDKSTLSRKLQKWQSRPAGAE